MSRIVIVEDNENIRRELSSYFEKSGYETACFSGGSAEEIREAQPDMILLDINLENGDGFALCREIRKESQTPIIFVTGREDEWDELKGIRLGGDDFVRKPYRLPVLLARVSRILERNHTGNGQEVRVGKARLDLVKGELSLGDIVISLPQKELQMLYFLCINQGKPVSRDALMEYLWENKMYVDENILNVNLSRLRKRLADAGLPGLIQTVPKKGYLVGEEI